MPVTLLLCEGEAHSADVRVLRQVLRGVVGEIRPSGGKDGFPSLVQNLRRVSAGTFGFCDGDFPRRPDQWSSGDNACVWTVGTQHVGWRWRRKEIENYLLDPIILQHALRWSVAQRAQYEQLLEGVFDRLGPSTAGRMALTACAPRKTRLETTVTPGAEPRAVEQLLRSRAQTYNPGAHLDEAALLKTWQALVPECGPAGRFRAHALAVFAGKDIAALIQQTKGAGTISQLLRDIDQLGDTVIDALERDPAPHRWLPEWIDLHAEISAYTAGP